MTNKETIVAIRRLVSNYVDGGHDALETVEAIADLVAPEPRCKFIRENYTVDPTLRFVFSKRTGKKVKTMVHAGGDLSPVPVDRAIWFILKGDDPFIVGRDNERGLYAIYEKEGERVYL